MSKAAAKKNDAVDLLDADHVPVKNFLMRIESLCEGGGSPDEKQEFADQICQKLTVHAGEGTPHSINVWSCLGSGHLVQGWPLQLILILKSLNYGLQT